MQPVTLYCCGERRPLLSLSGVEITVGNDRVMTHDFTDDKRVHFFSAAQLLVTIPEKKDRLILHRFDIEAALKKADVDFLLVTSQPAPLVKKGTTWSYRPEAKSKNGGV